MGKYVAAPSFQTSPTSSRDKKHIGLAQIKKRSSQQRNRDVGLVQSRQSLYRNKKKDQSQLLSNRKSIIYNHNLSILNHQSKNQQKKTKQLNFTASLPFQLTSSFHNLNQFNSQQGAEDEDFINYVLQDQIQSLKSKYDNNNNNNNNNNFKKSEVYKEQRCDVYCKNAQMKQEQKENNFYLKKQTQQGNQNCDATVDKIRSEGVRECSSKIKENNKESSSEISIEQIDQVKFASQTRQYHSHNHIISQNVKTDFNYHLFHRNQSKLNRIIKKQQQQSTSQINLNKSSVNTYGDSTVNINLYSKGKFLLSTDVSSFPQISQNKQDIYIQSVINPSQMHRKYPSDLTIINNKVKNIEQDQTNIRNFSEKEKDQRDIPLTSFHYGQHKNLKKIQGKKNIRNNSEKFIRNNSMNEIEYKKQNQSIEEGTQTQFTLQNQNLFLPQYNKSYLFVDKQANIPNLKSIFIQKGNQTQNNGLMTNKQFFQEGIKSQRSQSLNSKQQICKGQQTSQIWNQDICHNHFYQKFQKEELTHTPSLQTQSEYLRNYFNTPDANTNSQAKIINQRVTQQTPLRIYQPDSIFIPKVMTRNASFLKRGLNTAKNIIFFHSVNSRNMAKKDTTKTNVSIENQQKKEIPNTFKTNKDVLYFESPPHNIPNLPNHHTIKQPICKKREIDFNKQISQKHNYISQQNNHISQKQEQDSKQQEINCRQTSNSNQNIKQYLYYQNKFLGQKQHEFLMNQFKLQPQANFKTLKVPPTLKGSPTNFQHYHQESQQNSCNFSHSGDRLKNKGLSNLQQFEKQVQKKLDDQQEQIKCRFDELEKEDDYQKRMSIYSFKNQIMNIKQTQQLDKQNQYSGNYNLRRESSESQKQQEEILSQTKQSTKYEIGNLKKYYEEKLEQKQKRISQNNQTDNRSNKNNIHKLNNNLNSYHQQIQIANIELNTLHNNIQNNSLHSFNQRVKNSSAEFQPWNFH